MTEQKGLVTIGENGMVPQDFEGFWRMASVMHASKMMPQQIDSVEKVMVCIQMGFEVGLSPMQAVQNIAVINGRPTLWGDAVLALVQSSGLLEDFAETFEQSNGVTTAVCIAKRKGRECQIKGEFSTEEAKLAGLLTKSGPWKTYPKRMLKMRARAFCLRDGFPDVLKGLKMAEEAQDYDPIQVREIENGNMMIDAPESNRPAFIPPELQEEQITAKSFQAFGVTAQMLAEYMGKPLNELTEDEKTELKTLFVDLKEGKITPDFFRKQDDVLPDMTIYSLQDQVNKYDTQTIDQAMVELGMKKTPADDDILRWNMLAKKVQETA